MYRVAVPKKVQKQRNKIPSVYQHKIDSVFSQLTTDPLLGKPLAGEFKGQYSVRVWPYRLIYQIYNKEKIILITLISHRQSSYK